MNTGRTTTGAAFVLGLALALTACAGGTEPSPPTGSSPSAPDPSAPEVDVLEAIQVRFNAAVPWLYAANHGPAAARGLELTTIWADNAAVMTSTVVSGDAQVTQGNYAGVFDAVNQGIDLVIISEGHSLVPGGLTVQTMPGSGITTIEDLPGKRVGVQTLNSGAHFKLIYAMEEAGVDASTVEFVGVPMAEVGAALEQGHLDAATSTGAFLDGLRTNLGTVTVFDYAEEGGLFEGLPEIAWIATRDFAEKHPNTIAAFQCSMKEAAEAVSERATFDMVLVEDLDIDPAATANHAMFDFRGGVRVDAVQAYADMALAAGRLQEPFDAASIIIPAPESCD